MPLPPTPMQAKRIRSLGDLLSSAAAVPATNTPTPVSAVLFKNRRRSVKYDMVFALLAK